MSQRNVNSTGVSHWLIHCAARHAPHSFAQRLEEEWLAHLAERPHRCRGYASPSVAAGRRGSLRGNKGPRRSRRPVLPRQPVSQPWISATSRTGQVLCSGSCRCTPWFFTFS